MQQEYTISAIATPVGQGGIGIVRLSGEKAVDIAQECFKPAAGGKEAGKSVFSLYNAPYQYFCTD